MKSHRYESGCAENSIPPDCYFCLTQLYPYYYSVCAYPVPSCLYTYCVQCVIWSPGSCAYCTQKRKRKKRKKQKRKKSKKKRNKRREM